MINGAAIATIHFLLLDELVSIDAYVRRIVSWICSTSSVVFKGSGLNSTGMTGFIILTNYRLRLVNQSQLATTRLSMPLVTLFVKCKDH